MVCPKCNCEIEPDSMGAKVIRICPICNTGVFSKDACTEITTLVQFRKELKFLIANMQKDSPMMAERLLTELSSSADINAKHDGTDGLVLFHKLLEKLKNGLSEGEAKRIDINGVYRDFLKLYYLIDNMDRYHRVDEQPADNDAAQAEQVKICTRHIVDTLCEGFSPIEFDTLFGILYPCYTDIDCDFQSMLSGKSQYINTLWAIKGYMHTGDGYYDIAYAKFASQCTEIRKKVALPATILFALCVIVFVGLFAMVLSQKLQVATGYFIAGLAVVFILNGISYLMLSTLDKYSRSEKCNIAKYQMGYKNIPIDFMGSFDFHEYMRLHSKVEVD